MTPLWLLVVSLVLIMAGVLSIELAGTSALVHIGWLMLAAGLMLGAAFLILLVF